MSTMCSIPMLIEAARAGARPGKEFVVEAEAYRPLPSCARSIPGGLLARVRIVPCTGREPNPCLNPAETRGTRDCYLRRHLISRRDNQETS